MSTQKKKFSVLISEDHPDYQFLFKMALEEIDGEIELNFVYSSEQVVEYLIKDKLQRSLNRQVIPNFIVLSVKPPFKELEDVKTIRAALRFNKIPIYLLSDTDSNFLSSEAKAAGANEVISKPYTYHDLKMMLQDMIVKSPSRKLTKGLFCCRCEEYIEFDNEHGQFANQIRLSEGEHEFVKSRFPGALCIPCLNQLKTSYRILNGDFNIPNRKLSNN